MADLAAAAGVSVRQLQRGSVRNSASGRWDTFVKSDWIVLTTTWSRSCQRHSHRDRISLRLRSLGRFAHQFHKAVQGRATQARLAATEERLRFDRDVHDLLGHSLSVIALKAELATRLAPNDPDGAAQSSAEVQPLAASALREMREVVHGYREVDLLRADWRCRPRPSSLAPFARSCTDDRRRGRRRTASPTKIPSANATPVMPMTAPTVTGLTESVRSGAVLAR